MKKILFILMLLVTCFLFGCKSSKITYTNPETGEKGTIDIKPTEEPTDVYNVIYGLAYVDTPIKDFTNCSIVLDMNGTMDNNLEGEKAFKLDIKSRTTLDEVDPKNVGKNDTLLDYIKKVSASLNTTVTGSALIGTESTKIDSSIKAYIGDGMIYIIPNLNNEVINLFDMVDEQVPEMVKLINEKPLKLDMDSLFQMVPQEELRSLNIPLTFENKSIKDILKDNHINDEMLKQIIETVVKDYKVKITEVKKSLVTFSASANEYLNLEFTIDVSDMSILSLSFKQEINDESLGMKIKEEIIASIKYEANVEIISDDDKANALDIMSLIDSFKEMYSPSHDLSTAQIIEKAYEKEPEEPVEVIASGQTNFEVPSGGYDGSEVTLSFYHSMGSNLRSYLQVYIEEFNKIYPNIHIIESPLGRFDDIRNQISTELLYGAGPNIAYCYPDHIGIYRTYDAVVTLDSFLTAYGLDLNKNDFVPGFLDEGRRFGDGLLYSLPLSKATDLLYYNKTFFEQNNISVPDHWFSIDENDTTSIEYVCKLIKEIDPKSIPLGIDSEINLLFNLCSQMGTGFLSSDENNHYALNNDYTKSVMKILNDWYNKGYFTTQSIWGSYVSSLFTNIDPDRYQCYMAISSSASGTNMRPSKVDTKYPFEVGINPIPQIAPNSARTTFQGPSLCIFQKENPQEVVASWLFVRYLVTNIDFQAEFSVASGYMPVLTSTIESPLFSQMLAKADGYDFIAPLALKTAFMDQSGYTSPVAYFHSDRAKDAIKNLFIRVICSRSNDIDSYIENKFKELVNTNID